MSERPKHESELFYVAPPEAPPSRRPPLGTVGLLGWLRNNLFDGPVNSIMTIITTILVAVFLYEFLGWSIQDAQWSVVINNLKILNVGQYPDEELWRIEIVAVFLIFLSGAGLAIWGGTTRAFMATIVIVMIIMVLIPIASEMTDPAPIRFLVGENGVNGPMRFVVDEGETFSVSVNALNDNDLADNQTFAGMIETAAGQQENSRIVWSSIVRNANLDEDDPQYTDLSNYSLLFRVQILNAAGVVVEEAISTPENPNITLTHTAPEDTWFIANVELIEDAAIYHDLDSLRIPQTNVRSLPDTGYAWITLGNVPVFRTKPGDVERRTEIYGTIPDVECYTTDPIGCQVAERSLRFTGERSFAQYLRLQVSPYIESTTVSILIGVLVFFTSYSLGLMASRSRNPAHLKTVNRFVVGGWILVIPFTWIMMSGVSGAENVHPLLRLETVGTEVWQGLALTLLLTFISVIASLPLGVVLALGRRSGLPVIGTFSVLFIELIRGAPLITILFFAKTIVPFFFSAGAAQNLGDVIRMLIGLTMFSAAYQAEIVRGGLQIIPHGQTEAAKSLGLNPFYTNAFIILPQALRAVIPATMSQFVSLFKDTSLVSIIGLFELLGIVELIVNGQQQYRPFVREAYLYIGIIYFVIAFMMSAVSRRLEETGSGAARRR